MVPRGWQQTLTVRLGLVPLWLLLHRVGRTFPSVRRVLSIFLPNVGCVCPTVVLAMGLLFRFWCYVLATVSYSSAGCAAGGGKVPRPGVVVERRARRNLPIPMENESSSIPHLHKIIFQIYTHKINTKNKFQKKWWAYLSEFRKHRFFGSQISKDNIFPGCSQILSNIFGSILV